ncbi:MAG: hypothetical protein HOW73_49700 [Polyangiaceae bacterium]|nr:hypothetical protein [Polyangiaceae bacterium]
MLLLEPTFDRPDSKIGQGLFAAPKWVILGLGAASIVIAGLIVFFIVRSRLRAKRGDDFGPVSSRGRSGPASSRPPPPRTRA